MASVIVVMGVAGCGKSAFGSALAEALGAAFVEGDRLHPPENVARMASGQPLTDDDRRGWLDAVGGQIVASSGQGRGVVAACSALKRSYRDHLRSFCPDILFLFLEIDRSTAEQRVASRHGHFMPASLVESQFEILEAPKANEKMLKLDAGRPLGQVLETALSNLR